MLKLSSQEQLSKIWHQTIQDNLKFRIEQGIPDEENKRRLGYLFNFERFILFIEAISKEILQEPIPKMMEKIEFSQGLVALRNQTGQQLSFLNLITNYEALKQAKIDQENKPKKDSNRFKRLGSGSTLRYDQKL